MVKSLLSALAALISVLALFWVGIGAAEVWEHRPPHSPVVRVWILHWAPKDGLKAQRDAALADRDRAKANEALLLAKLADTNRRLDAMSAETLRIKAAASDAVEVALHERAALQSRLNRLAKTAQGVDRCARAEDGYQTAMEALR